MLYCHECEQTFEDFKYKQELVGEFMGAPAYETHGYCPHCGSDNYDELTEHELEELLYGTDEEEEEE